MIGPIRRPTSQYACAGILLCAALTACGSHSINTPAATGTGTTGTAMATTSGGSPAPVETNPPGDIPDNQAYTTYTATGFTVSVPEGWSKTTTSSGTVFSDKYNNISIQTKPAAQAPTNATVAATDQPAIQAASSGFTAGQISQVQRHAGAAVLMTYQALSAVNPVTGKVAREAVERYAFFKSGHEVVLTLAAPVGSDNVDPWRKVTDSLTWTGP